MQDPTKSALAGPVGPDHTENRALGHRERDVLERAHAAVVVGDRLQGDDGGVALSASTGRCLEVHLAEVRAAHGRVIQDRLGCPLGDELAEVEGDHPVRDGEEVVEDVVDDDHADAVRPQPPDVRREDRALLRVEAAERLVEDEQAR